MKRVIRSFEFEWDEKKNDLLKETRHISFETVIEEIKNDNILAFMKNKERYKNQYLIVIEHNNYPWVIPCKIDGKKIRLITAYPSRKFKKLLEAKDV